MKYVMMALSSAVLVVLLFSCNSSKKMDSADSYLKYQLSKGACFGSCPVMDLEIYSDGKAILYSKAHYRILGKYETMLSGDKMNELSALFTKNDVFQFPDNYESQIPDLPQISIFYSEGTKDKTITGKEDRPTKVMELQFALEDVVDRSDWKLLEAIANDNTQVKEEKPEIIPDEILVTYKEGTVLPRWFKKHTDNGIKLIKPISQENRIWLITYDTNKLEPNQALILIQNDEEVENAEFNKVISSRGGNR
ncbi:MAG: DUF6438 domain-containing protein [Saprospiraceae bacterium]